MTKPVARLNDRTSGTCDIHGPQGGTITTASDDVKVNNRGIARLTDKVTADCGHVSQIVSASGNTNVNGLATARIDDAVGGGPYTATIITGSDDSIVN